MVINATLTIYTFEPMIDKKRLILVSFPLRQCKNFFYDLASSYRA